MIFITGDTHADSDYYKLSRYLFPEGKYLTKNDYVIICGDFGGVWGNKEQDKWVQSWYDAKPWTTLFIDGNHDNHDMLDNDFEVEEWNGGKIHKITPSIYHLMRGQIYTIDGKTFFTMGGANSIDKEWRLKYEAKNPNEKIWWEQEMPSEEQMQQGIDVLKKHNNKVDYIITHDCPASIINKINENYKKDALNDYLEIINNTVEFKHWFFGHYHTDMLIDEKYHLMYDKVDNIERI